MSPNLREVKQFLTFSKGERNGIIVLLVLIILLLFVPLFYQSFVNTIPSNDPMFYEKVDSFFSTLTLKPEEITKNHSNPLESEVEGSNKSNKYFEFDPNTVTVDELVMLGLSIKQAYVVEKYRSKGGKFYSDKDFAKVYVIDSATFRKLKPWIRISKVNVNDQSTAKTDSLPRIETTPTIVELNTADTIELTKVKGIGKTFARRIVAYRSLLGGFVSIHQLKEVYGIRPELIGTISNQIVVDSTKIRTLNLNLVSYEDLKKHPYLTDFQSKAIIYYRSKVGTIKSVNDLLSNKIVSAEKYGSLKNYLTTK